MNTNPKPQPPAESCKHGHLFSNPEPCAKCVCEELIGEPQPPAQSGGEEKIWTRGDVVKMSECQWICDVDHRGVARYIVYQTTRERVMSDAAEVANAFNQARNKPSPQPKPLASGEWRVEQSIGNFFVMCDGECHAMCNNEQIAARIVEAVSFHQKWKDDSSLESWFPLSAEEMTQLRKALLHTEELASKYEDRYFSADAETQELRQERDRIKAELIEANKNKQELQDHLRQYDEHAACVKDTKD